MDPFVKALGFTALVIVLVTYLASLSHDCSARGGILMKNAWGGYQCVQPLKD